MPLACKTIVPFGFTKAPRVALRMPTSKLPAVRLASAPTTTMLRSFSRFWNPKSPNNRTDPPITVWNPSTATAMVLAETSRKALIVPTVRDCFTENAVEL